MRTQRAFRAQGGAVRCILLTGGWAGRSPGGVRTGGRGGGQTFAHRPSPVPAAAPLPPPQTLPRSAQGRGPESQSPATGSGWVGMMVVGSRQVFDLISLILTFSVREKGLPDVAKSFCIILPAQESALNRQGEKTWPSSITEY